MGLVGALKGVAGDQALQAFAHTGTALRLMEAVAASLACQEAILLVGETGCGKTSVLQHLAALVRPLLPFLPPLPVLPLLCFVPHRLFVPALPFLLPSRPFDCSFRLLKTMPPYGVSGVNERAQYRFCWGGLHQ